MTNGDFINVMISDEKVKKIVREIGFIHELTIKNYSSLSNINKYYCLKFQKPVMHRQFYRIISQNPDYVEHFCNNENNPSHFACRQIFFIIIYNVGSNNNKLILLLVKKYGFSHHFRKKYR